MYPSMYPSDDAIADADSTAAWLMSDSTHPGSPARRGDGHHDDHEKDGNDGAIDPVCGMTVDRATAREKGLHREHQGTDYYFCGKGCYLEFGDDPERYLDPSYVPSM